MIYKVWKKTLQNGFSLVEMLVALGIMTGGMTAMMSVSDVQTKTNLRAQINREADQIVNDIQLLLDNEQACRNSLFDGAPVTTLAQLDANINDLSDKDGVLVFNEGLDYSKGRFLRIDNIRRLTTGAIATSYPAIVAGQEYAFQIAVDLVPRRDYDATADTIIRVLPEPIYIEFDAAGDSQECLTSMGRLQAEIKRETCESMGGAYRIVDSNRDIWCTLTGNGNGRVEAPNPNPDPTPDFTQGMGAAQDFIEDLTTLPYVKYLQEGSAGQVQDIVSGSITFSEIDSTVGTGIVVSSAGIGTYAADVSSGTDLTAFELGVPNYAWLNTNFREMMRYQTTGSAATTVGPTGDTITICDESGFNIVMVSETGQAMCIDSSAWTCGYAANGSPEYFKGIDINGDAVCVPIISGTTNCPQGGNLVMNAGSLEFSCFSCTPTGTWVNTGDPTSCFCDGTTQTLQRCETSCGGDCGGQPEGATQMVAGTCTAPAYCGTGGSGSTPTGDSGNPSSCGYSCTYSRFRDFCNCCPASYPLTGSGYGCCENAGGAQVCM